jgi:serine/threonine protein kinase/WD40 repeat protein
MGLSTGTRLGPYEILSSLGAGGMGEVYRARDTRLERTVAVKVLNSNLSINPELKQRFEREARAISALQHPHVCVLHDIGHQDGTDFLVMEYLEGETLSERLRRGPLPMGQFWKVTIEVVDALDKAHRAGIVHRDLKPGNIMLTKAGAKLLDFGLAKTAGAGLAASAGTSPAQSVFSAAMTRSSPASPLTSAGSIVGTVQYMAPEQIEGREADARSDIFSFGLVLYEMITGTRAFEGKTQASVVAAILALEPKPLRLQNPEVPRALERMVQHCLEKDPAERFQNAHDLRLQMQLISEMPPAGVESVAPSKARHSWLPWAAAGTLAVAATIFAVAYTRMLDAPQTSVHSYILPPAKSEFNLLANWSGGVAISRDGKRIAFVAKKPDSGEEMLWIQSLDSATAQPMTGTENAGFPFWSYDGHYVGFFEDGKLQKIAADGGPPQTICDAKDGRGGVWNQDDVILFTPTPGDGLFRVPAAGGTPTPVTDLQTKAGETSHRWPVFLPDGKHYLFWIQGAKVAEDGGIYVGSLDSKERRLLVPTESSGAYAEPGYLLFVRDGTLLAQKFNLDKMQLEGDARPVAAHVGVNTTVFRSILAASATGTLVYLEGGASVGHRLVWYGLDGKPGPSAIPEEAQYRNPVFSPDGKRLAASVVTSNSQDIWIFDLQQQSKSRLTFAQGRSFHPTWSSDGRWIYYSSFRNGRVSMYRRPSDGTGNEETVLDVRGVRVAIPNSISRDGKYLAYEQIVDSEKSPRNYDLYVLPLFGDRTPIPQLLSPFLKAWPEFSPDGKWLAYASEETGRLEIYVMPFPGPGGKYQVSTGGGDNPKWSSNGRQLFFSNDIGEILAADVRESGAALQLGTPREVLKAPMVGGPEVPFAVSPDGKRLLLNQTGTDTMQLPLALVTNWTAELKK